MRVEHKILIYH